MHIRVDQVALKGTRLLKGAGNALQLLISCLHLTALLLLQPRVGREVELCCSPAVLPGPDRPACCCSSKWRR